MNPAGIALCLLIAWNLAACGQEPYPQGPQVGPEEDIPELTEQPLEDSVLDESTLRMNGIGDVMIGGTLAEASTALGEEMMHHEPSEGSTCSYAFSPKMPGVAFMLDGETIVRIDTMEGDIETPEGIGIGDTEEAVRAAYGEGLIVTPHKYTDGHYLTVDGTGDDAMLRYVFETDGQVVTAYRAGRLPQVEWIEGCS